MATFLSRAKKEDDPRTLGHPLSNVLLVTIPYLYPSGIFENIALMRVISNFSPRL